MSKKIHKYKKRIKFLKIISWIFGSLFLLSGFAVIIVAFTANSFATFLATAVSGFIFICFGCTILFTYLIILTWLGWSGEYYFQNIEHKEKDKIEEETIEKEENN